MQTSTLGYQPLHTRLVPQTRYCHLRYLVLLCNWLHSVITVMISTHCTMDLLTKNSFTGDSAVTIVT